MTNIPPPRRRSSRLFTIDITGYVMPVDGNRQPILLSMLGGDGLYIAVFSSFEKFLNTWAECRLPEYERLVKIEHGIEFIESLKENGRPELHLIVDPYKADNGKLRWTEIPLLQPLPSPT